MALSVVLISPCFWLSVIVKQGCVTVARSPNELFIKGNEGFAPSILQHLFTETDAEPVLSDLRLEGEAEGDLSFRKANVQRDYSFITIISVIPNLSEQGLLQIFGDLR